MELEHAIVQAGHAQLRTGGADAAIGWLASRQHGVVARGQLLTIGLSRGMVQLRIDRQLLRPLFRGVYAVGHDVVSPDGRRLAGVLAAGGDAAVCHRSAGEHLRLLVPRGIAVIHVASPHHLRARAGLAVHSTALRAGEIMNFSGVRVTTGPRTLLDLASVLGPGELQRAVHEAEVRKLCRPSALARMLEAHPRARGSAALRKILRMAGGGPMPTRSELEDRFLRFLHRHDFQMPRTNVSLETARGAFEVDCYWPEVRHAIELDGDRYHGTAIAKGRDVRRDRALLAIGISVTRVNWQDLDAPEELEGDLGPLIPRRASPSAGPRRTK